MSLFPPDHFDCIVSIATLHHVLLEEMLTKMMRALTVNGVLLILDLYQESRAGAFTTLAALPVGVILMYLNTGRFTEPPEERAAWAEHVKHEFVYDPLATTPALPGALAWDEDQEAPVVALLAYMEEDCMFVKKDTAIVVGAWFFLAACPAL